MSKGEFQAAGFLASAFNSQNPGVPTPLTGRIIFGEESLCIKKGSGLGNNSIPPSGPSAVFGTFHKGALKV